MSATKSASKKSPSHDREARRREFYRAIDAGELNVRAAVRSFRKMLGMNQREFAKFTGISPRILMAFEQGSGNPTLATLEKMLKGSGLELQIGRKRRREAVKPMSRDDDPL